MDPSHFYLRIFQVLSWSHRPAQISVERNFSPEFKSVYFAPAACHLFSLLLVCIFPPCWLWCCILIKQYLAHPQRKLSVGLLGNREVRRNFSVSNNSPNNWMLTDNSSYLISAISYCYTTAWRAQPPSKRIQHPLPDYIYTATVYKTVMFVCFLEVLREGGLSC